MQATPPAKSAYGRSARHRRRYVFLVFTIRERAERRYIRPISARYMHKMEIAHYEQKIPTFRSDEEAERFVETQI